MPSQSGYPFITDYGDPRILQNPTVPGTHVKIAGGILKGDVATVTLYYWARFDAEIEDLDQGADDWGFDPQHNATTSTSNHKSATAVDGNALRHPQHVRGTFTAAQYNRMHEIQSQLAIAGGGPVLRLGIDFSDHSVDEMHEEIAPNEYGTGRVGRAAAAIRAGRLPNVPAELRAGGSSTTPSPTGEDIDMTPAELRTIVRQEIRAELVAQRDDIANAVWDTDVNGTTQSTSVMIRRIREVLASIAAAVKSADK